LQSGADVGLPLGMIYAATSRFYSAIDLARLATAAARHVVVFC
jgi:hypothetical protein